MSASRNELYLSMRFLDVALSSLRYEMNLSSLYVGTDGEKILFNPRYLIQRYLSDRVLVNRAYPVSYTHLAVYKRQVEKISSYHFKLMFAPFLCICLLYTSRCV